MTVRVHTNTRNAIVNAVLGLLDADVGASKAEIRSGSQPAAATDAASGTLLATVVFADPAGTVSAGVLTFTDPAAVTAVAAGTATWARLLDNSGDTILDCTVSATGGGGELQLATVSITVGLSVDVTAFSITAPA